MEESQERLLPIANVGRMMKQALPQNAKISKEAKERMQECATEFISFVTSEAPDKCRKDNRKTLNGEDICRALSDLGFENLGELTSRYLYILRELEREKHLNQLHNEDVDLAASYPHPSDELRDYHEAKVDNEARNSRDRKDEQSQCLGLHIQQRSENPTISLGFIN